MQRLISGAEKKKRIDSHLGRVALHSFVQLVKQPVRTHLVPKVLV